MLMEYVLAHEWSHYRHRDHIWALLRSVALVLHWYNPLVWLAILLSRQDGELACDARTIDGIGQEHRGEYGRMLIHLSQRKTLHAAMLTATSLADGKTAIKERIVILMKHPKTTPQALAALGLCCLILVGCTFTAAPETTDPAETTPVETTSEETTVPDPSIEETTAEYLDDLRAYAPPGYEYFMSPGVYRMKEHSNVIHVDGHDFTLTIPEEWTDQVEVLVVFKDYFNIRISGKARIALYESTMGTYPGEHFAFDWVVRVIEVPKEDYLVGGFENQVANGNAIIAGENEDNYYVLDTDQSITARNLEYREYLIERCGQEAFDEAVGEITASLDEALAMFSLTPPEADPPVSLNSAMEPLESLLEGSDIEFTVSGDSILLSEDGLTVELQTKSKYVRRDGRYIATMAYAPEVVDGQVYVDRAFYNNFLMANDADTPSLFHGMLFFADEIVAALNAPEDSAFNRKLLAEVLLPTSMGITSPHVDVHRWFQTTPLSELSSVFQEELKKKGFTNVEDLTYTEYEILSGERASGLRQRAQGRQDLLNRLTDEEKAFLEEKGIQIDDVSYLNRIFYYNYMAQSDEALKEALEEYYATDIAFMGG